MTNQLADYIIAGLEARYKSPEAIKATKDPNFFCEYCFRDDEQNRIIQAPHHAHFQKIVTEKRRAVVLYPVGFGKTTQVVMRIIWELGNNPAIRIVIIGANADAPRLVLGQVARELVENPRVKEVFPDLRPAVGTITQSLDTWRGTAMRVAGAPPWQKDPSISSYGIDGKISGARVDLLFGDNMMNFENTSSKLQRDKMTNRFLKEAMTRLVPKTGRAIITDTAWTKDDLPHKLMAREAWHAEVFDAETNPFGEGVLWESRFPMAELMQIKADITALAYDQTYRNIPLSESMQYFKQEFWDISVGRVPWIDDLNEDIAGIDLQSSLVTGVDLATRPGEEHDLTVFSSVLASGHRRRLLHMHAERMQTMAIARKMVAIYRALHKPINFSGGDAKFVVEDNSAQIYIVDMLKDGDMLRALGLTTDEVGDIRVTGRTTTSKRRDQELGIPGLAAGLEMGRWDIAKHEETKALREEMRIWYPGLKHYGDRLMATWIAMCGLAESEIGFGVAYV